MSKILLFFLPALLLFQSCGTKVNELDMPGYEMEKGKVEIPAEAMGDIIDNLSSPVEMAFLVRDLGVPFSSRHISDPENIDPYGSSFYLALKLGMLGADLGYLNVYEKTGSAVTYLSSINQLADALKISQFFDFRTLKRLATGNGNIDSLMFLSVHSFNQMDEHLRETERSNLSSLMLAGTWIEGMYQVTQVAEQTQNEELAEYIGEQKIILNDLILMLQNYEEEEKFAELISDFEDIKKEFEGVRISYLIREPEKKEKDGMLMVIQKESSEVEISKEVLTNITQVTQSIRNKHLKM